MRKIGNAFSIFNLRKLPLFALSLLSLSLSLFFFSDMCTRKKFLFLNKLTMVRSEREKQKKEEGEVGERRKKKKKKALLLLLKEEEHEEKVGERRKKKKKKALLTPATYFFQFALRFFLCVPEARFPKRANKTPDPSLASNWESQEERKKEEQENKMLGGDLEEAGGELRFRKQHAVAAPASPSSLSPPCFS